MSDTKFKTTYYALMDSVRNAIRNMSKDMAAEFKSPEWEDDIFERIIRDGFEYFRDFYKGIFKEEAPKTLKTGQQTWQNGHAMIQMMERMMASQKIINHPDCDKLEKEHFQGLLRVAEQLRERLKDEGAKVWNENSKSNTSDSEDSESEELDVIEKYCEDKKDNEDKNTKTTDQSVEIEKKELIV